MQELDRLALVVQVAQLYYEHKQTQQEIARLLNLSRPTICRLLQEAEQRGVVQISVVNPLEGLREQETDLEKTLKIKKAIIIPNLGQREQDSKRALGEKAARFLRDIVRDGDTIAVSWGTTLYETALVMLPKRVRGVKVVQCNGGVGRNNVNTHAAEIIDLIGAAFNAASFSLPIPAVVDNRQIAEMLRAESQTKLILDMLKGANIALFSVGIPTGSSILVEADISPAKHPGTPEQGGGWRYFFPVHHDQRRDLRPRARRADNRVGARFPPQSRDLFHRRRQAEEPNPWPLPALAGAAMSIS